MKITKITAMLLCLVLIVAALFACTPPESRPDGEKDDEYDYETRINETKTQLYVSNFNGAFGDSWLKAAAQRYSELHKDDVYETGKKGVQIWIDPSKQGGADILAGMSNSRDDIFFTEFCFYYDFVKSGKCLDLTDIITEKLTKYGESQSILDKLTKEQQEFYNADGHYYFLPHYQAFRGITYDVDMFEEELLYFADNANNGNDGFITGLDDVRSKGPDNVAGTYDDGLPATYDDFFKLCQRMSDLGITPVIWSGSNQAYFTEFLTALAADYEGLSDMSLNFSFSGIANHIVDSISDDGTVTLQDATQISNSNGYALAGQAGKYYALSFAERLISNNYYDKRSFGTLSHTECQKEYLYSNFDSTRTPIAMLIESNYWENEAYDAGYFNAMAKKYSEARAGRNARRFGFMPYPKATSEQVGEGVTLVDYLYSAAFIRGNIEDYKKGLALDFLQFLYTDVSLVEFTEITGCPKSLNYSLGDAADKVSYYTKCILDLKEHSDLVFPFSGNPMYKDNASAFSVTSFWSAEIHTGQGLVPYNTPSRDIRDDKITAKQFFDGMLYHFSESNWNNSYSRYWETV